MRSSHSPASHTIVRRGRVLLGAIVVPLALVGTSLDAGATVRHSESVPVFCQRLSLAKIDAIVSAKVTLATVSDANHVSACVYRGVPGNMSIETETGLPASQTRSLSAAEAASRARFPAGLTITFAKVSGLGSVAFTWHAVIGTPYSGLNVYSHSTGYFIEMGGAVRLSVFERLERLAVAA